MRPLRTKTLFLVPLVAALTFQSRPLEAGDNLVFFGSHSVGPGLGISVAHFDSVSGALTKPELVVEAAAPAFFVLHPDGRHLYTCNSNDFSRGWTGETVSAYEIDAPNGGLTLLNQQSSGGADPSYVTLDAAGRHLLVANYKGGSVAVLAINPDGSLAKRTAFFQHTGSSVNATRQTQPYAHSVKLDPGNRFALVADLGVDKVFVYRFNKKDGSLQPNDPPFVNVAPGSGPRHIAFHPRRDLVYLINEMASTIIAYAWDSKKGSLAELQTVSTLPAGFAGTNACAEIEVHPNGRFLYGSNRGHDSLAVFAIDEGTGTLSLIEHVPTQGQKPRNFAFDRTGRWLIVTNHGSDNAVVFRVDVETGRLTPIGRPVSVPSPFCVRFLSLPPTPSGR
jgi:6-phosphogluconolactonase